MEEEEEAAAPETTTGGATGSASPSTNSVASSSSLSQGVEEGGRTTGDRVPPGAETGDGGAVGEEEVRSTKDGAAAAADGADGAAAAVAGRADAVGGAAAAGGSSAAVGAGRADGADGAAGVGDRSRQDFSSWRGSVGEGRGKGGGGSLFCTNWLPMRLFRASWTAAVRAASTRGLSHSSRTKLSVEMLMRKKLSSLCLGLIYKK